MERALSVSGKRKGWATVLLCILLILLVALSIRLWHLGRESLWLDEGYALDEARQATSADTVHAVMAREGTPPLYFLILQVWIAHTGDSLFALRLPSVIFSVASVIVIIVLGRILFGWKTGLFAGGIMALSMVDVLYSQEARPYSLFILLIVISTLFFALALREQRIGRKILLYALYCATAALMLWTHSTSVFVIAIHGILFLLYFDSLKMRWFLRWLLWMPIAAFYLIFVFGLSIGQHSTTIKYISDIFILKYHINPILVHLIPFAFLFLGFLLITFAVSIFFRRKKVRKFLTRHAPASTLFLAVIIVSLLIVAFSRFTTSIFLTRYTLFLTPFLYLALARGITLLPRRLSIIAIVILAVVLMFDLGVYHSQNPRKEDWKGVASFISSREKAGEIIIIDSADAAIPFDYHYTGQLPIIRLGENLQYPNESMNLTMEQLSSKIQGYRGAYVIFAYAYWDQDYYRSGLRRRYTDVLDKNFKGVELQYYSLT